MKKKRKVQPTRSVRRRRATSVARLTAVVRKLSRRIGRLEGHRRRIGFRARRDDGLEEVDVRGELVEQEDDEGFDGE